MNTKLHTMIVQVGFSDDRKINIYSIPVSAKLNVPETTTLTSTSVKETTHTTLKETTPTTLKETTPQTTTPYFTDAETTLSEETTQQTNIKVRIAIQKIYLQSCILTAESNTVFFKALLIVCPMQIFPY